MSKCVMYNNMGHCVLFHVITKCVKRSFAYIINISGVNSILSRIMALTVVLQLTAY